MYNTLKKLFLIVALLFSFSTFAQTIRRVNNTPGLNDPNIYTTAQAAHDAAVDGDIISLEPGATTDYGDLIATKKVTIYGTGYFHNMQNSNSIFDKRPVTLRSVNFNLGSSNSTMVGVNVEYISINIEKITISRCRIINMLNFSYSTNPETGQTLYASQCIVTRCIIYPGIGANHSSTGHFFSNNIIFSGVSNISNSVFENNTFNFNRGLNSRIAHCNGSNFLNNIIDSRNDEVTRWANPEENSGIYIHNNIGLGNNSNLLPVGNGNVNGADPNNTFVIENPFATIDNPGTGDAGFKLSANSPAKTVGVGGIEAGAFGGIQPYVLSGVPNIPTVTSFINSGTGNSNTPLSVTISVKSSN